MIPDKNKKGQVKSILMLMIVVFVVGVTIILGKFILTEFTETFTETVAKNPDIDPTVTADALSSVSSQYAVFDYAMVIVVIVMIIGLIVSSYMIPTHPIFIVINIIGIFVLVFMGMLFTNIYGELVVGTDDTLTSTADEFNLITYLIIFLPYIGAISVFISSIIMYVRGSQG